MKISQMSKYDFKAEVNENINLRQKCEGTPVDVGTLSDTMSVYIETQGESVLMLVSSRPALR